MATVVEHPSKERVREYIASRIESDAPPPDPKQIRRELGWTLSSSYDANQSECPR